MPAAVAAGFMAVMEEDSTAAAGCGPLQAEDPARIRLPRLEMVLRGQRRLPQTVPVGDMNPGVRQIPIVRVEILPALASGSAIRPRPLLRLPTASGILSAGKPGHVVLRVRSQPPILRGARVVFTF